jgi:GT2 family glycosyltransferase
MNSSVDVIVPVYGAIPLVIKCLDSLKNWNVILVDDGNSGVEKREIEALSRIYENVTLVSHDKNMGFVEACHTGVLASKAENICFINSDIIASDNALFRMLDDMGDDNVGIVGCKLLYPQNHPVQRVRGRIQHCGVLRGVDGFPYHPFGGLLANTPHASTLIELNCVTGGAMMVRRYVWNFLGGFDRQFSPGMFEDVDFCYKARHNEMKVLCDNRVSMWHYEHGSAVPGQPYFVDGGASNGYKLYQKWGYLGSDEDLMYGKVKGTR